MTDIGYMIEHVAADLIVLLVEERGLIFTEAVDIPFILQMLILNFVTKIQTSITKAPNMCICYWNTNLK